MQLVACFKKVNLYSFMAQLLTVKENYIDLIHLKHFELGAFQIKWVLGLIPRYTGYILSAYCSSQILLERGAAWWKNISFS